MAFVLTNFIGFETGNAQEASATSGTPVYTTTAGQFVSGSVGLDMGNGDEYDFLFDPAGLKTTPDYLVVGFKVKFVDATPASDAPFFAIRVGGGSDTQMTVGLDTAGKIYILDDADVKQATGTTVLSDATWYTIEVRINRTGSSTGAVHVYLDSNSTAEVSATSIDAGSSADVNGILLGYVSIIYFDDVYVKADTADSAVSDLIGAGDGLDWDIPGYYQPVTGGISTGTAPAVGSIANLGENPLSDANEAEWTGSADDADWAADGTRAGPLTDITDTVIAGKYWFRADSDGGGGTTHYLNTGKYTTAPSWTHTENTVTIAAGNADYYLIEETNMPATTSDSMAFGIRIDGAKDLHIYEVGGWILQTISAGGFTQALAGALTSSGALTAKAKKPLAGALTPSGVIVKKAFEALAGALTPTGTVARVARFMRSYAGVFTSSGTVKNKALKKLAGALTSAGTIVKKTLTAQAGGFTSSGTIVKKAFEALAGALTPSGTIAAKAKKALAGALTSAGTLTPKAKKALAGALTSAGALTAKAKKALAGALTLSGTGVGVKVVAGLFYQAIAGAFTSSGTITKKAGKPLAGALTLSGTIKKKAYEALAGAVNFAGTIKKKAYEALAGGFTSAGTIVKKSAKALAGALTSSGTADKKTFKAFAGAFASGGTVVKKTAKALAGALTSAGALVASLVTGVLYFQALAGAATFSGTIVKKTAKALAGAITFIGTLFQAKQDNPGYGTLTNVAIYAGTLTNVAIAGGTLTNAAVGGATLADTATAGGTLTDVAIYGGTLTAV